MDIGPSDIHTVILAGAQSARIRPLSLERPKTLIPICNQPILKRLLKTIIQAGLEKATLSLPLLWAPMDREILALAPNNFDLRIGRPEGLFKGTVRDIVNMVDSGARSVLILSGDSLLSADLGSLIDAHRRTLSKGGVATLLYHRPADLLFPERDSRTYHGVLSVEKTSGRIVRFIEKPNVSEIEPGFDLANAAVFICERSFLESETVINAKDFSHQVFQPAVAAGTAGIFGCDIGDGYRIDVGTVKRFYDTNMRMLKGEILDDLSSDKSCGSTSFPREISLHPPYLIGDDFKVGRNVTIGPNAIIGNSCTLSDGVSVQNSVILDNCQIGNGSSLDGAILGTSCRIGDSEILRSFSIVGAYSSVNHTDWPYSRDSEF